MRKSIFGAGGYAQDIMGTMDPKPLVFVDHEFWGHGNSSMIFNPSHAHASEWLIAVGNSKDREAIVRRFPQNVKYFTYIEPGAVICDGASVGMGSRIGANSVISGGVRIGRHAAINFLVCIGHDAQVGDFFTIAPLAGVMGWVEIGNRVEIGAGAQILPRVRVCDDVVVGAGAVVTKDITEPGTYAGIPARRLEKRT